jgi:hypothetical protein
VRFTLSRHNQLEDIDALMRTHGEQMKLREIGRVELATEAGAA